MKLTRRNALFGVGTMVGSGSAAGLVTTGTVAQDAGEVLLDQFPPLPPELEPFAPDEDTFLTNLELEPLGTARPKKEEIEAAQKVLIEAPYAVKPHVVARYFQEVGQGSMNQTLGFDARPYVRGWPVRYNPVIINLFRATGTNPLAISGDYTAWCAAFVNWCIARGLSKTKTIDFDANGIMQRFGTELTQGTDSASSGSFRCWPRPDATAARPKPGDVIVWALNGTVSGCSLGKGHVGFFMGRTSDGRFKTLGGNQRDPSTRHFAVVEKGIGQSFQRSDGTVKLHSIRTSSIL